MTRYFTPNSKFSCLIPVVYKKWQKDKNQKRADATKAAKKRKSEAAVAPADTPAAPEAPPAAVVDAEMEGSSN